MNEEILVELPEGKTVTITPEEAKRIFGKYATEYFLKTAYKKMKPTEFVLDIFKVMFGPQESKKKATEDIIKKVNENSTPEELEKYKEYLNDILIDYARQKINKNKKLNEVLE